MMRKYPAPVELVPDAPIPLPPRVIEFPSMNLAAGALMNVADSQSLVIERLSQMLTEMGGESSKTVRVKIFRDGRGNMNELIITRGVE